MKGLRDAVARFRSATDHLADRSDAELETAVGELGASAGLVPRLRPAAVLRQLRMPVKEVVDVGVRAGSPFLYNAFPDAHFVLVDPQKGGEALLKHKPSGTYHFLNVAVGAQAGSLELKEQGALSTFLDRTPLTAQPVQERYMVELRTLDRIIQEECRSDRIGLKIDTEGFELDALKGLNETADRIGFLVAEVSILQRFENSYTFSEFVEAAAARGFELYRIMQQIPPRRPTRFLDCLFLRRDDPRFSGTIK